MDMLKKFFPYSFGLQVEENAVGSTGISALVIRIIVYLVAGAVIGCVASLIPGLISSLVGLYSTVGIVLLVLDYLKVLK